MLIRAVTMHPQLLPCCSAARHRSGVGPSPASKISTAIRFSLVSFDEVTHAIETQRRAAAAKSEAERRLVQELEIAKQVQARLFPKSFLRCKPSITPEDCIQARQVGGDYYDFLASRPAAARARHRRHRRQRHRRRAAHGQSPGQPPQPVSPSPSKSRSASSRSVNRLFFENTPDGAYATFFFAEYDDRTRRLRYANCGHLSGMLLRSRRPGGTPRLHRHRPGAFQGMGLLRQPCRAVRRRHPRALYRRRHRSRRR